VETAKLIRNIIKKHFNLSTIQIKIQNKCLIRIIIFIWNNTKTSLKSLKRLKMIIKTNNHSSYHKHNLKQGTPDGDPNKWIKIQGTNPKIIWIV